MLLKRRTYLAAAVAAAFCTSAVTAEELLNDKDIEVIVVTASGFEQKLVDAPASISVITQEELSTRPYSSLVDAVRDLEGVDIGETSDKTGQRTISMRGMGSDYTLILINGRRQNNNGDLYPNSFAGNQFNHIPPLDAIERIEVIRGPAATLYGADALGGVINIITKKVIAEASGSITHTRTIQSNSDFGDDITTDFNFMTPLIANKLGMALRGSIYNKDASNPEYPSVTDPDGVVHSRSLGFGGGGKTVENTNWSLGGTLNFTPTENQDIVFDYDTSKQKYDNEGNQLGTEDTYNAMLRLSNALLQPRAGYAKDQRFTREQWSVQHVGRWDFGRSDISLSYVETDNLGRTLPYTVEERGTLQTLWNTACTNFGSTATTSVGNCVPDWLSGRNDAAKSTAFTNLDEATKLAFMENNLTAAQYSELLSFLPRDARTLKTSQYTLDAKLEIPLESHRVIVGGQLIDGEMEDGIFGMYGGDFREGTVQKHDMWALFAEDNWDITSSFTLTGGIRYDDHNVFGSHTSPRLYGVYTVNPSWTVKGGVATGYKTPKTSDLFPGIRQFGGQGVSPSVGNPTLKPETSVNYEVAVYYSHEDGHNFNATIFHNRFEDKISSGGDAILGCEIAPAGERCADVGVGWADLGYRTFSQSHNIDRVDISGAELAGRYKLPYNLTLRGNYTYTDSEQKSGSSAGRPLNQTAKHMANATLDWKATDVFNIFLTLEMRSKRYRGWDADLERELHYKDYEVLHLGASYRASDSVTFNMRINNLLDEDFTTYQTSFVDVTDDNGNHLNYTASYIDDFNNKDKARNVWIGVNVQF